MIRIDTLMDDTIFAVTNGLYKLSKQLMLGMYTLNPQQVINVIAILMDVEIFSTIYKQYRKTRGD
jgi:hypothetical protein